MRWCCPRWWSGCGSSSGLAWPGQRCLAARAIELGLASDEAGLLAETVRAEDTTATLRQQVDELLRAGQLRAAQQRAAGLPAGDPRRSRVNEVDAKVDGLSRAAATAEAEGEIELAAERLAEAIGLARDDDVLASRLAALPPPAPGAAHAQLDGQQMLITWEPSPAHTGRVRYRVCVAWAGHRFPAPTGRPWSPAPRTVA